MPIRQLPARIRAIWQRNSLQWNPTVYRAGLPLRFNFRSSLPNLFGGLMRTISRHICEH